MLVEGTKSQNANGTLQSFGCTVVGTPLETWTSGTLPNFHRRVARGELLPHTLYKRSYLYANYCRESWFFESSDNAFRVFSTTTDGMYNSPDMSLGTPSTFDVTALAHKAASSFMSRCQFDAGTALAEVMKIRGLYSGLVQSFANAVKNGVHKASSIDDLLSVWLSARYGLRPILYDIQDFEKALRSSQKKTRKVFTSAAAQAVEEVNARSPARSLGNPYFDNEYKVHVTGTISHQVSISGEITPYRVQLDPAKTAWELVPYSFVLDWFLSVGDWIDSVRLTESGLAYFASYSTKTELTRELEFVSTPKDGWNGFWSIDHSLTGVTIQRLPMELDVLKPGVRNDLSPAKVLDMLALAFQPISRHAKRRWGYVPFNHPYPVDYKIR